MHGERMYICDIDTDISIPICDIDTDISNNHKQVSITNDFFIGDSNVHWWVIIT